jgi:hypothetical protein
MAEVSLEKIQLGALMAMSPTLLHELKADVAEDFIGQSLGTRITGYIYGKRGLTASDEKTVVVPKFPRWLPRWLRNRWTQERTVRLDCTPMILFPEVPHVFPGTPRVAMFDKSMNDRTTASDAAPLGED